MKKLLQNLRYELVPKDTGNPKHEAFIRKYGSNHCAYLWLIDDTYPELMRYGNYYSEREKKFLSTNQGKKILCHIMYDEIEPFSPELYIYPLGFNRKLTSELVQQSNTITH